MTVQSDQEWLTKVKPAADAKLRRLGIPLNYTVGFVKDGRRTTGNCVEIGLQDQHLRDKSSLHIMLHELSHVFAAHHILKHQNTAYTPEVRSLFGKLTETTRSPVFFGQTSPEETFADIFVTYTMMEGDMSKIRHRMRVEGKGARVYKQLEWMDRFVKSVASKNLTR
jgi:hypothetical protein